MFIFPQTFCTPAYSSVILLTYVLHSIQRLVSRPSIAQLVERWTVVVWTSIGRWFESGSKDILFLLHKQGYHHTKGSNATSVIFLVFRDCGLAQHLNIHIFEAENFPTLWFYSIYLSLSADFGKRKISLSKVYSCTPRRNHLNIVLCRRDFSQPYL